MNEYLKTYRPMKPLVVVILLIATFYLLISSALGMSGGEFSVQNIIKLVLSLVSFLLILVNLFIQYLMRYEHK